MYNWVDNDDYDENSSAIHGCTYEAHVATKKNPIQNQFYLCI